MDKTSRDAPGRETWAGLEVKETSRYHRLRPFAEDYELADDVGTFGFWGNLRRGIGE